MADSEHVAKLKKDVTTWNKWREDNPAIIPDLNGAN
ncbi:MAG: pentapeptide repeat-containing protein, partial [Richelia sp. RM2_1_2]|nr:pentapeptide repeat-containing protein [Richelia sp. RM2_1_2]